MASRHSLPAAALALVLWLVSGATARAQVTLPNGLVVPRDSGGEVQVYELFASRGEPIDWIADARATPDVFSPLCDFTATLVLHEAGSSLGVGWYNVTGAPSAPTAADVYQIVPPGSPVGTTVTGANIRSDSRYLGGLIGLALIRSPLHFTEARWNTICNAGPCAATPGPWILSVSYPSRVRPNAWYVAFEDGDTSSSSWNNDGDYNDYVFFFTGLACAGAGEPCTVAGAIGICASGLTECDTGGALVCRSTTGPGTERCNGADDDCDGTVDGDGLCPPGELCLYGSCRPPCFESSCATGETCTAEGICLEDACTGVTCATGERCAGGSCVGLCSGVVCPGVDVCLGGRCSDPCEGVTCAAGRVCDRGVCVEDCTCRPCASGLTCGTTGECIDPLCVGVTCTGAICRGGACVDACDAAVCPAGQTCTGGECVDVPSGGGDGGTRGGDGGSSGGPDGAVDFDGGVGSGDAGRGRPRPPAGSCGCRVASNTGAANGTILATLGVTLAALGTRAWRTSRRAPRRGDA